MHFIKPWYLSTFAVAEQLYDAVIVWDNQKAINVTNTSLPFFRQFIPAIKTGTYRRSTSTYSKLLSSIKTFADGFVLANAKYTPINGGLAEQYTRNNGSPLSAKDLTWSYVSALTAFAARGGFTPESWGATGLAVPSVCHPNPGPIPHILFTVNATTEYAGETNKMNPSHENMNSLTRLFFTPLEIENVFLVGSIPELGNWDPSKAIALSPTDDPRSKEIGPSSMEYPYWMSE
jgi:glucoamylase